MRTAPPRNQPPFSFVDAGSWITCKTSAVPPEVVALTAVVCGSASVALARWMRGIAEHPSDWLTSGLHALLATLGGAGAALLAVSWAEVVAFAALALACALLVAIDLAEHRLPDVIVLPMYAVMLGTLTVEAAVSGEWAGLVRSVAAMAALGAGYFALAWINPSGLGLGDVKLAGVLGLFLGWFGWASVLAGTLAAFLLGGAFAVVLLITRRANRRTAFPFGPWMVAGAAVGAVWVPAMAT